VPTAIETFTIARASERAGARTKQKGAAGDCALLAGLSYGCVQAGILVCIARQSNIRRARNLRT